MRDIRLICEGTVDKVDIRVLDSIIDRHFGVVIRIQPAGGDKGLGSVRQFLEASERVTVLTIEDRNYRPLEEALATWSGRGLV